MKKQIKCVSVVQNAKMMAVLYLVLSLPLVALFIGISAMTNQAGVSMVALVVLPLGYALGGFVGTALAAWVYNLVAGMVGGFEFTTAEVKQG